MTAYYFLPAILFALIISKLLISSKNKRRRTDLPPSPPSLPFIGHLHLLKEPIHRTLQTLSQQYGPIYLLSLGVKNVVVVSSPSLAEECFNKNDIVLANRPMSISGKIINYNYTTVAAAPYGPHWRNLRRFTAVELLSTARLNSSVGIRQDEVRLLISSLFDKVSGEVEMRSRLNGLSLNIVMRMVAGKRYFGTEGAAEEGERFQEVIREVFDVSGASNPADFLPVLRWIDYGGMEKRMRRVFAKFDAVFQDLIEEHRGREEDSTRSKTMIGAFLTLQESEPETYSDDVIKGHVMTIILAGTDTSAATIEWAMSLLLNHPKILNKARTELDDVVGKNRLVQESPLLVPHYSSDNCTIGGYHIPKGTTLLANAWAIHRDPEVWDDPTNFRPERYEGLEVEGYKLLPFGMGRRSCPGSGLANKVVSLALGALIQSFEWKRISEESLDMSEGQGLTMPKVEPLRALCKVRECLKDVLIV
ncbi:unnamed protein product [Linum tenue]|uniref:Cytochrome P450 n=1 Tax=Linum tenue TaxID=586396 RepID=A0AAV0P223_9ROSI|nr:unnamed protein product [Linum tenue]